MKYILDDSALFYMLEQFPIKAVPELYKQFIKACNEGDIIAERETRKRLEGLLEYTDSYIWLDEHKKMFREISQKESVILGELVQKDVFKILPLSMEMLRNIPIAIPFIIAIAKNENRVVVVDKKSRDCELIRKVCELSAVSFMILDDCLAELGK
ncbi:MAG: DUF4411 family protein [Lachnospiraceae bacterium]|nr:DUF4411 family protein [Lachnospiraceae bacterium]